MPRFGGSGSGPIEKYYTSFFISDSVTQYFVKPTEFKGSSGHIAVDFTFRNTGMPLSTVNFTLTTKENISDLDKAAFSVNGNQTVELNGLKRLFIEKNDRGLQMRYSATLPYNELKKLMGAPTATMQIGVKEVSYTFTATGKTLKTFHIVKDRVLDIQ